MMGILLHLLIVEDSEDDAQLILREIKRGGYDVVWERVETRSAMEQALARQPWDLISCDNGLPQFSASEALSVLKESSLDTPLIIISGTIGEEAAVAALKAGAHDFLVKGKLARLIPAIQRELREAEGRRERRLTREALRQSEEGYRTIFESAAVAILEEDFTEVLPILEGLKAQGVTDFRKYFSEHPESNLEAVRAVKVLNVNQQSLKLFGAAVKIELRNSLERVFLPETMAVFVEKLVTLAEGGQYFEGETAIQTLQGERREVLLAIHFPEPGKKLDHTLVTLIDITERKQIQEQLVRSEQAHRSLFENVPVGLYRTSADGRILDVNPAMVKMFGYKEREALLAANIVDLYVDRANDDKFRTAVKKSDNISDFEAQFRHQDGTTFWAQDHIHVVRNENGAPLFYEGSLIDITEPKRTDELIQRQLKRLNGLRAIDIAISSNSEIHALLDIILLQVVLLLGVDAAAVFLFNPSMLMLEYGASLGIRSDIIRTDQVKIGDGYAGRAILERQIIHISNSMEAGGKLALKPANKDFVDYYGVPLIAKGEVKGVLEIYHRTILQPDKDWLDFLETLARQAAIGLDNAKLFDDLQRSNKGLALAYDATIEGWSRAMDLRDKETEGHTVRVTDLTIRLARALKIPEPEILHIRRGALLHDIGKMGVPDHILFKPGELTPDEWMHMRKHPTFALEMLSPIAYLKSSLDIPYCHHEKWDGSGYPRGLKGEEIPLSARIFAIVDVWDALLSDRPYRKGWSVEKARDYLLQEAGKHFDPQVVDVFFAFLATDGDGNVEQSQ